jgi:hypothetical protein
MQMGVSGHIARLAVVAPSLSSLAAALSSLALLLRMDCAGCVLACAALRRCSSCL